MSRSDGRSFNELREIKLTRNFTGNSAGSVLVEFGNTKVLCTASIETNVPRWLSGSGKGWVTAEYAMLPGATDERSRRESVVGKVGGRTHEISRLVARSLRAAVDLTKMAEQSIIIDCDVLEADGGTRTASITGGYVALVDAIYHLSQIGKLNAKKVLLHNVAAISVGVVDGNVCLDLPYEEDSRAEVDMNVVATSEGDFVEIQGTGEQSNFSRKTLDALLDTALLGISQLVKIQNAALRKISNAYQ